MHSRSQFANSGRSCSTICRRNSASLSRMWVDRNGNVIPKLYSKAQANRDLREMLNIDGRKEQEADDVSRLSDAELIQQLAGTAKELGIEINLNYSFLQRNKPDEEPQG
jgi:hypothetical protein